MKLNPFTRASLLGLLAAPITVAVILTVVYFTERPKPLPAAAPNPQVLGENFVPLRQAPMPEPAIAMPTLIKPLDRAGIKAKSYLVYDVASGSQLANLNETYPLPIASLTKLMTGYVAYKQLDLSTEIVPIGSGDKVDVSPELGVLVGDHLKAIDLFNSMLVGSANDAAQTLANYVAKKVGLAFPLLMNQEAEQLGMKDTHYSNSLGFDSETNYSTAADLRILVNAVQQYKAFSLVGRETGYQFKSEDGNNYSVKATNKLVAGDPEISAIKTGFTDEAQGAMITEINHDDHKFIIIVLSSPNREQDTLKLKRAILDAYSWQEQ